MELYKPLHRISPGVNNNVPVGPLSKKLRTCMILFYFTHDTRREQT